MPPMSRVSVGLLARCMCLVLVLSPVSFAEPAVRVLALFPGKAMLEIDGKRKVLAAGAVGPGGVRLVEADPAQAVVEIAGRRQVLRLGTAVAAEYRAPSRREVRIVGDASGSYYTDGLVNGQPVRFLVDTGATNVTMSEDQARRLGLQHRVDGVRIGVGTASGRANGFRIRLDSVTVGGLRAANVGAVVIDGNSPRDVLLGMSFLGRFDMEQRANLMILRSDFQ
jgi:aspartyl protease family protein